MKTLLIKGTEEQIALYKYLMEKATRHVSKNLLPTIEEDSVTF